MEPQLVLMIFSLPPFSRLNPPLSQETKKTSSAGNIDFIILSLTARAAWR
jgi:hypothetical protein